MKTAIDPNKKCMRVFGVSVSNIITVALLSGLISVAVGYLILMNVSDFQWWWLFVLFGTQVLSVVAVAYIFKKTLTLNNMFSESPLLFTDFDLNSIDWSKFVAPTTTPAKPVPSSSPVVVDAKASDWADLLRKIDDLSKEPIAQKSDIGQAIPAPVVSASTRQSPPQETSALFDFLAISSVLAPKTLSSSEEISSTVATPSKEKKSDVVATPVLSLVSDASAVLIPIPSPTVASTPPEKSPSSFIDFAALFGGY